MVSHCKALGTCTVVLILAAFISTNALASTADDEVLGLSTDGSSEVGRSIDGLFDGAILVPGDVETEKFFIHNTGSVVGYVTIVAKQHIDGDTTLREAFRLGAGINQAPRASFAPPPENRCIVLETQSAHVPLQPEDTAKVNIELSLNETLSGTDGQDGRYSMDIMVLLSQLPYDGSPGEIIPCPVAVQPPSPTDPEPESESEAPTAVQANSGQASSHLAITGAHVSWLIGATIAGTVGCWLFLLVKRRHSDREAQ